VRARACSSFCQALAVGTAYPSAVSLHRLSPSVVLIYWLLYQLPLNLASIVGLVWSFSLNYTLPIALNAVQPAISSYLQRSNIGMLLGQSHDQHCEHGEGDDVEFEAPHLPASVKRASWAGRGRHVQGCSLRCPSLSVL
jgi:hypothetical protein